MYHPYTWETQHQSAWRPRSRAFGNIALCAGRSKGLFSLQTSPFQPAALCTLAADLLHRIRNEPGRRARSKRLGSKAHLLRSMDTQILRVVATTFCVQPWVSAVTLPRSHSRGCDMLPRSPQMPSMPRKDCTAQPLGSRPVRQEKKRSTRKPKRHANPYPPLVPRQAPSCCCLAHHLCKDLHECLM